ncbi:MAG TPA: glycoside hydrolase family 3 N-terminal domain-containing protein [Gemmatimonadaceae bacterium]|nr:glycoside hydrolase family 3 N-terminal domain-containing protein [Gemmatimonadaceae bacterium]
MRPYLRTAIVAASLLPGLLPAQRATRADSAWVRTTMASMSLRQKVGQMVWPSLFADYVAADDPAWQKLRSWIASDQVGGFTMSIGSPMEMAAKLNEMQRMAKVPLVIGADLEAGAGFRASGGYFLPNAIDLGGATTLPPLMALGATRDTTLAYEYGKATAVEGRALGIHIVYGPVLDVNNNSANPVINVRSFGEDPAWVARLGAAFVRGVQDNGMLATGKHFPGHGDTDINSHLALPVVTASRARLDSVELPPFRASIAAGVGAIMTFHGAMPALDSTGVPGTLSPAVLTGVLRKELGFNGMIISDAMDMRGVLDRFGAVEAAKLAVIAGADVLIQPENVTQTIDAVVAGVSEGRISRERIDMAVRRILLAKASLGLQRRAQVDLARVRRVVGDTANRRLSERIAARAITLVRDSARLLPLVGADATPARRILHVVVARSTNLGAGAAFASTLGTAAGRVRTVVLRADDPLVDAARILPLVDSSEVVLMASYMAQQWDQASAAAPDGLGALVSAIQRRGKPLIMIGFGNPYLGAQLPSVGSYLIAWNGSRASQVAAARAILGSQPFNRYIPITMSIAGSAPANGGVPNKPAAIPR